MMVIWTDMRRFTAPTCHSRSLLRCWATSWGSKQSRTWGNWPIPSAASGNCASTLVGRGDPPVGEIYSRCHRILYHLVSRGLNVASHHNHKRDNGILQSSNQYNEWDSFFFLSINWLDWTTWGAWCLVWHSLLVHTGPFYLNTAAC